jgi:uncharacterized membrane protein
MQSTNEQGACALSQLKPGGGVNVGMPERWLSLLSGGALLAYGLYRRGVLGGLCALGGARLVYRGVSGHCSLYEMADINTANIDEAEESTGLMSSLMTVKASITIEKPVEQVFAFWRDLSNLQIVIPHVYCVSQVEGGRSQWVSEVLGREVYWEALIIDEEPNQHIGWKTLEGSDFHHAGGVEFTPTASGGTEVRVHMHYRLPGGPVGVAMAKMLNRSPQSEIAQGLQRLKEMIEKGELVLPPSYEGEQNYVEAKAEPRRPKQKADAIVHDASEASFPASDPPSFSSGHT